MNNIAEQYGSWDPHTNINTSYGDTGHHGLEETLRLVTSVRECPTFNKDVHEFFQDSSLPPF